MLNLFAKVAKGLFRISRKRTKNLMNFFKKNYKIFKNAKNMNSELAQNYCMCQISKKKKKKKK